MLGDMGSRRRRPELRLQERKAAPAVLTARRDSVRMLAVSQFKHLFPFPLSESPVPKLLKTNSSAVEKARPASSAGGKGDRVLVN